MTTVSVTTAGRPSTADDPAVRQYFGSAMEDLQMASDALQSGKQLPSWIGTRLLSAGNELMVGLESFGGGSTAAAVAQVRNGVRALGRPMCITGQLPQTSVADLVSQLHAWSATISAALAA